MSMHRYLVIFLYVLCALLFISIVSFIIMIGGSPLVHLDKGGDTFYERFFNELPLEERKNFLKISNINKFFITGDQKRQRVFLKIPIHMLLEEIDKAPPTERKNLAKEWLEAHRKVEDFLTVFSTNTSTLDEIFLYDEHYLGKPDVSFDPKTNSLVITYQTPKAPTFLINRENFNTITINFPIDISPHHFDFSPDRNFLYAHGKTNLLTLQIIDLKKKR